MTRDDLEEMFTKKVNKEVIEFDELGFRLFVEERQESRHEQWLRVNLDILDLNSEAYEINKRYVAVLEKIEKHLAKLLSKTK